MPKIFISHASANQELVSLFIQKILVLGCGLADEGEDCEIFYTSDPSHQQGIPTNENFIDNIRLNLQEAPLVILLFSQEFMKSQFCLQESGATWMLDRNKVFSIIIPPLTASDFQDVYTVAQKGNIDDKGYLNKLRQRIHQIFTDRKQKEKWEEYRDEFLDGFNRLPQTIVEDPLDEVQKQLSELRVENTQLKELIEELKRIKDPASVESIEKQKSSPKTNDELEFERLVANAKNALSKLPKIVGTAFYGYFNGHGGISFNLLDRRTEYKKITNANNAVSSGWLIKNGGEYILNFEIIDNSYTRDCLNKLFKLTSDLLAYSDFGNKFYEENRYQINYCKNARDFWRYYLLVAFSYE